MSRRSKVVAASFCQQVLALELERGRVRCWGVRPPQRPRVLSRSEGVLEVIPREQWPVLRIFRTDDVVNPYFTYQFTRVPFDVDFACFNLTTDDQD